MQESRDVDGLRWYFADSGARSRSTIVALHGLGATSDAWTSLFHGQVSGIRLVLIDLPGYSLRRRSLSPPSVDELAFGLTQLLFDIGVQDFILIGHSFGAAVAVRVAGLAGSDLAALILIAAGGFGPEINPIVPLLGTKPGRAILALSHRKVVSRAIHRFAAGYQDNSVWAQRVRGALSSYEALEDGAARAQYSDSIRAAMVANKTTVREQKSSPPTDAPVFVIWGSEDQILPVWHLDVVRHLFPQAELFIMPGAGHTPHTSQPEDTRNVIDAFLLNHALCRFRA